MAKNGVKVKVKAVKVSKRLPEYGTTTQVICEFENGQIVDAWARYAGGGWEIKECDYGAEPSDIKWWIEIKYIFKN